MPFCLAKQSNNKRLISYPDSIEGSGLETTGGFDGVPMHRIRDPCDNLPRPANSSDQMRKLYSHILSSHSGDHCNPSWLVMRI